MPIPENPIEKSSDVTVTIKGDIKKIVIEKKREMRAAGLPSSNEIAILKLIQDCKKC